MNMNINMNPMHDREHTKTDNQKNVLNMIEQNYQDCRETVSGIKPQGEWCVFSHMTVSISIVYPFTCMRHHSVVTNTTVRLSLAHHSPNDLTMSSEARNTNFMIYI